MSKEQTPIEEANKWLEKLDVKMWLQTIITDVNPKACLSEVLAEFAEQLLTKEKEQREELKEYIEKIANHPSVYDSEIANEGLKLIGKENL